MSEITIINQRQITDYPNQVQFEYTLVPEDIQRPVIWKSDNTEVATIDQTGLATAITNGMCNIQVTVVDDPSKYDSTVLTVDLIPPLPLRTFTFNTIFPVTQVQTIKLDELTEDDEVTWDMKIYQMYNGEKIFMPNQPPSAQDPTLLSNLAGSIFFLSTENNQLEYKINVVQTNPNRWIYYYIYATVNGQLYEVINGELTTYTPSLNNYTINGIPSMTYGTIVVPANDSIDIEFGFDPTLNKDFEGMTLSYRTWNNSFISDFSDDINAYTIEILSESLPLGNKIRITNTKDNVNCALGISYQNIPNGSNAVSTIIGTPSIDTTKQPVTFNMLVPAYGGDSSQIFTVNVPRLVEYNISPSTAIGVSFDTNSIISKIDNPDGTVSIMANQVGTQLVGFYTKNVNSAGNRLYNSGTMYVTN